MDEGLWSLLPDKHAQLLKALPEAQLEELRIAAERPLTVRMNGKEQCFGPKVTQRELEELLQRACRQSVYAHTETLRQGYLTLEGGHRLGICGFGVVQEGVVRHLHKPSSVVIRIAKEVLGCAEDAVRQCGESTLILGPPGSGKTTLLRDFVRLLSDQYGQRVGLVDERGELSASTDGVPQLQVGWRTDVLLNIPKADAIFMLLRTMNPQWIAVDEITAPADLEALVQASYCGVKLLGSAHGESFEDLSRRPLYRKLMEAAVFSNILLIRQDRTFEIKEVRF